MSENEPSAGLAVELNRPCDYKPKRDFGQESSRLKLVIVDKMGQEPSANMGEKWIKIDF